MIFYPKKETEKIELVSRPRDLLQFLDQIQLFQILEGLGPLAPPPCRKADCVSGHYLSVDVGGQFRLSPEEWLLGVLGRRWANLDTTGVGTTRVATTKTSFSSAFFFPKTGSAHFFKRSSDPKHEMVHKKRSQFLTCFSCHGVFHFLESVVKL